MTWTSIYEKAGNGICVGLTGNIAFAGMAAMCLMNVAPGTYLRAGMEFLGFAFYAALFAVFALPISIYDLVKRRYWGILGLALSVTPFPLSYAVYSFLFRFKGLHIEG